ncbi:gliding motility-associated C-terminal domain-containing protein [Belliella buryatensis]|uniref:Gliding motility-associated C-terminal domain-containing protein n=1 Tax=Belliella buryatensis TaxID=1500549 RepID=A0A239BK71_9BACT|nr:gliding motility-associated C-terminal domain-containing protein [Belliella buryatensis]SNS07778.1 gliding motility-associated C-terminal domain-containing protein [Belliella buryatensis]
MKAFGIKYGKFFFFLLLLGVGSLLAVSNAQTKENSLQNAKVAATTGNQMMGKIEVNVSGKLALCSHAEKGHIILDVFGGTAPYTFRWNNNATEQNRYNLFAGTYTVFITDAKGLQHSEQIVVQPPFPLIVDLVETKNASCGSSPNGSAKINVRVGRGEPYRVEWSHGLKDKMEATNLPAGDYTATVYDIFNCSTTIAFSIGSNGPAITVAENVQGVSCADDQNGAISLQVSGGQAPFTYKWSNGKTTKDISGLSAGNYQVLIEDAAGCSLSKSFEIKAATAMELEAVKITDITCAGDDNGTIELGITGGQAPFTYEWSNGAKTAKITNLKAGSYSVKVNDAVGCSVNGVFEVKAGEEAVGLKLVGVEQITCHGSEDGAIEVEIVGGVAPFSVLWSDGVKDSLKRTGLKAGAYTVRVSDAGGCNTEQVVNITAPQALNARLDNTLDVNCATGEVIGVAWVNITGGQAPYTIKWNSGAENTREINFNSSTEISIEISDANGCTTSDKMRVSFPEVTGNARLHFEYRKLEITSEPEVFINDPLQFESYIAPEYITWEWDFGDGSVCQDKDPVHTYKKAGEYEVKLTAYDIYGCSAVEINHVQVLANGEIVVMPNAFSPNGDGLNDTLKPVTKGISAFQMDIFNHWGEHLYSENGLEVNGWDGTFKGRLLPPGNYVYKITYKTSEGQEFNKTGGVTLIR